MFLRKEAIIKPATTINDLTYTATINIDLLKWSAVGFPVVGVGLCRYVDESGPVLEQIWVKPVPCLD